MNLIVISGLLPFIIRLKIKNNGNDDGPSTLDPTTQIQSTFNQNYGLSSQKRGDVGVTDGRLAIL